MRLLVLSDLHIHGEHDSAYRVLIDIVRTQVGRDDRLVLAGDIFELFVGNRAVFKNRYADFLRELQSAVDRGAQVHFIEGNHDFFLGRAFGRIGVHVHPVSASIDLGGRRFYIAHGDTVDRSNFGYRLLRGFLRSWLVGAFVWLAPGRWVDWVGKKSSSGSRYVRTSRMPAGNLERLRVVYRNFAAERLSQGFDFVVLGHSHDADEMGFRIGDRQGEYYNVGAPREIGSFLRWSSETGKFERVEFK